MTRYHAVMLDETGCEFGVTLNARNRADAHETLRDCYAESRCVQLETPAQTRRRERQMMRRVEFEYEHGYDPEEDY